jgi:hypothetical protein
LIFSTFRRIDEKYHPTVPSSLPLSNLYNTSVLTELLIIKMGVFRDTVGSIKQQEYKKYGAQQEFLWCFHFTKPKIIDVRDFVTDRVTDRMNAKT